MFVIRDMLPGEADQKGHVHYQTWLETYTGLIDEAFLANQTLEKCQTIARKWPDNTLIAELDGKMVGYCCYGKEDSGAGHIFALYLLKEAQGIGLGRKLMNAAMDRLSECCPITLGVLEGNQQAIGFYEHYGFRFSGNSQVLRFGNELEMIYQPK